MSQRCPADRATSAPDRESQKGMLIRAGRSFACRTLSARPQIIESTFDRVRYGVYNQTEYRMLWE
jgi:hypothetical protein